MTVHSIDQPLIGARHALGHTDIDAEHFAIADCWKAATHCEPIALPFLVARLRRAMRTHFTHEAALVEAVGTHFCSCHRDEHDVMLELCEEAYGLAERDIRASRARLRKLPRLFREHIVVMDQIAVLIIHDAMQERVVGQA